MSEWRINQWRLKHPVHDTFFVGAYYPGDCEPAEYTASRVYKDASHKSGLGHEYIPAVAEDKSARPFASLQEAQAAIAQRIAELDAQIEAERCDECGGALVHVAGDKVRALLCPECNRDSSAEVAL